MTEPGAANGGDWRSRVRSFADEWFPRHPPSSKTGRASDSPREWVWWLLALVTAVAFAAELEWIILAAPLPPGGDPGQWLSNSFPFAGLPYPSQVVPFGYPPLLFPLLGFLVRLGGGPIEGARLYLGVVAVLLGLATYTLGRTVLRRPVLALLAQGAVLIDTPFLRLFFFGAYPTLLGMVFFLLAVAFGIRFLRTHRPSHLIIFYLSLTAAILTHSLVGVMLVALLGLAMLLVISTRRLPREMFVSRAGIAGLVLAGVGIGGYYIGTAFVKVPHPNYLQVSPLSQEKQTLATLLYAFNLSSVPPIFGGGTLDARQSFAVTLLLIAVILSVVVLLATLRPAYLTFPVIALTSWLAAVLIVGVIGWELMILTDFRRFAYFLFIPIVLGVAFAVDVVLRQYEERTPGSPLGPEIPTVPGAPVRRRRRLAGDTGLSISLGAIGVVAILLAGGLTTLPQLQGYETQYTGDTHSQAYLNAIGSIQGSGIPGSILTDSVPSWRWTRTLTDRNTYAPVAPTGFIFSGVDIRADELTYFTLNDRYTVTNGLSFFSVSGHDPTFFNASPLYGAFRYGIPEPILRVVPATLAVQFSNNTTFAVAPAHSAAPSITLADNATPGPTLSLVYAGPGYSVTIRSVAGVSGKPNTILIQAHSFSAGLLTGLAASLAAAPGRGAQLLPGTLPGSVRWQVAGFSGSLTSLVSVSPAPALLGIDHTNLSGLGTSVPLKAVSPGSAWINLSIIVATPQATNLITTLPHLIESAQVLVGTGTRFVLLDNITNSIGSTYAAYLEGEYGATPFALSDPWVVLLLPSQFASFRLS